MILFLEAGCVPTAGGLRSAAPRSRAGLEKTPWEHQPGLSLHPFTHLLQQCQARRRGLCCLTPHLSAPVRMYVCVCMCAPICLRRKNITPCSQSHERGHLPRNQHQAHLGHSLTSQPLLRSLSCGAGGTPRTAPPSERQAGPRAPSRPAQHRAPPGALEARSSPCHFPICSEATSNV